MAKQTVFFGLFWILIGAVAFFMSDLEGAKKFTALIPAAFGVLFVLFGAICVAKPGLNKLFLHITPILALLGAVASGIKASQGLGAESLNLLKVGSQLAFAISALIYIVLCVRSFIAARRARA